jgi:hypothetical protein
MKSNVQAKESFKLYYSTLTLFLSFGQLLTCYQYMNVEWERNNWRSGSDPRIQFSLSYITIVGTFSLSVMGLFHWNFIVSNLVCFHHFSVASFGLSCFLGMLWLSCHWFLNVRPDGPFVTPMGPTLLSAETALMGMVGFLICFFILLDRCLWVGKEKKEQGETQETTGTGAIV